MSATQIGKVILERLLTFADALRQTAQLAFDLSFEGAPILYSWPASEKMWKYFRAKDQAGLAMGPFWNLLNLVRTEIGADTVHIIAHSMGSQVLFNLFQRYLAKLEPDNNAASVRQIIFAAPDIDAENFATLAEAFKENTNADRVTVYISKRDRALAFGSFVHGSYARVGSSAQPDTSVDTIDASAACPARLKDFFCHALLASPPVIRDLNPLIRHGDPPEKRSLTRRSYNGLPYYELNLE